MEKIAEIMLEIIVYGPFVCGFIAIIYVPVLLFFAVCEEIFVELPCFLYQRFSALINQGKHR